MSPTAEIAIQAAETDLKQAMLTSDVARLDQLLASDLVFINHLGQPMTKQDDLNAHRSGIMAIETVELSDQTIKVFEPIAIVNVAAHIRGQFAGEPFDAILRFTRVWQVVTPNHWQVIAAQATKIQPS